MGTLDGARTDEFNAVANFVFIEVGVHIPTFHPFGYNAKVEDISHLDPLDDQDVVMFDFFAN